MREGRGEGEREEVGDRKGEREKREEGVSNKMFTAWSVINAQILPESRGCQFNFKSQKVQNSCRGVCGRIWAIICYMIMKGQFISCVYLSKWEAGSNPDNIPLVCMIKETARYIFRGIPMQQDEPLQGWWHWPSPPCSFPPAQVVALNPVYTISFIQSKQEYFLLKVTSYQAGSLQTIYPTNKPGSCLAAMGRAVSKGNHPILWSQMSLCLQYWSLTSEISPHCPSTGGILMLQDYLHEQHLLFTSTATGLRGREGRLSLVDRQGLCLLLGQHITQVSPWQGSHSRVIKSSSASQSLRYNNKTTTLSETSSWEWTQSFLPLNEVWAISGFLIAPFYVQI